MFLKNFDKLLILKIFIFFSWVAMWISINSMPGELEYMEKNIITFVNGMRTIFAVGFSSLTILLALFYVVKKNKESKYKSLLLKIFIIYFISQFIGLIFNQDRSFDLNNTYLVLYAIGTISILYLLNIKNLDNLLPIFLYFLIFILILSIIFVLIKSSDKIIFSLSQKSFYYLLHPDIAFNYQAPPRITGFARSISIINIFLIILYLVNHKKFYSYFLISIIYFLSIMIWLAQSRGAIICFYTSTFILIFFLNNLNFFKKIIIFFIITLLAMVGSNFILSSKFVNINDIEIKKIEETDVSIDVSIDVSNNEKKTRIPNNEKSENLEKILKLKDSRFYTQRTTSGRTTLWKESLRKYNKQIIFGYGPQADRIILDDKTNKYGNNVSNASLYAFLSGGYPSLICIILIYLYFFYLSVKFFFNKKIYNFSFELNKNNILIISALTFSVFFMIRSIIENSFSVFSIDFLITIFSIFIVEKENKKKI